MEGKEHDFDVVVVGGGPTGLLLALDLYRHGVTSLKVLEQRPEPTMQDKTKSKAVAIHARTLEVLEDVGVLHEFLEQGLQCTGMRMMDEGVVVLESKFAQAISSRFKFVLSLPQYDTETILQNRCMELGIDVMYGATVEGVEEFEDGGVVTLRSDDSDTQSITAKWVVACDGAHSIVRRSLGVEFVGEDIPSSILMADVRVESQDLPPGTIFGALSARGMSFFFPEPKSRMRVLLLFSNPEDEWKGEGNPPLELFSKELKMRVPSVQIEISDPHWLTNFTVRQRMLQNFRKGRILFAGDAAHCHSPAGGMGMNTGMQDAYNLAWKLAWTLQGRQVNGISPIDSYEPERMPVATDLLRGTGFGTKLLAQINHPAVRCLRWLIRVSNVGSLLRYRRPGSIGMTDIAYPDSPLNSFNATSSVLRRLNPLATRFAMPGMRAPDSSVTLPSRDSSTLQQLFLGTNFTALIFDSGSSGVSAEVLELVAELRSPLVSVVVVTSSAEAMDSFAQENSAFVAWDEHRAARGEYGIADGCSATVLVRPDGHIGMVDQPVSIEHLAAYMSNA